MRASGRFLAWAGAVLAAAELALLGGWLATGASVLALLVQTLLIAVAMLLVVGDRYLRIRRRQWAEYARAERMRERTRLAEDLHDVVGHELSLIAIRAGGLQVHSSGAAAAEAAALRADVQRAVTQLREIVALLGDDRPHPSTESTAPVGTDIPALAARARDAGLAVALHGDPLSDVPAPVRLTAHRVVQECLTNAAKYAPGARVEVRTAVRDGRAEVTVAAGARAADAGSGPADTDGGGGRGGPSASGIGSSTAANSGTGLASLRRRVEAIGGAFDAGPHDGRHVVHARLPLAEATGQPLDADEATPRPRPLRETLRWALVPTLVMAAVTIGFHTWATYGSTLEPDVLQRVSPGDPSERVRALLPDRQAPMRFAATTAEPPGVRCGYYTDGNFPLGLPSFRICHDGASVTHTTDLRRVPLW